MPIAGRPSGVRSAGAFAKYRASYPPFINFFPRLEPHPLRHAEMAMAIARLVMLVELLALHPAVAVGVAALLALG